MHTRGARSVMRGLSYTVLLTLLLAILQSSSSKAEREAQTSPPKSPRTPCHSYPIPGNDGRRWLLLSCVARGFTSLPELSDDVRGRTDSLNMRYNHLTLDDPETFRGMFVMFFLNLGYNNIRVLKKGIFDDCKNLHLLGLRNNAIETIEPDVFAKNTKLVRLYLQHNSLVELPRDAFGSVGLHAHIHLDDNPLATDYRLCGGLYTDREKSKEILYSGLSSEVIKNVGNVTEVCSKPCYSFRPEYLNVCPNAFCKGTVGDHQCIPIEPGKKFEFYCGGSGHRLAMTTSEEDTFAPSEAACNAINGYLARNNDLRYGCAQELVAQVRKHYNLDYTPVAWIGNIYKGNAFATNGYTYAPTTTKLYRVCYSCREFPHCYGR
ncbi:amphoterin-induced protein 3-like isoform X2 [Sycon ciliatum]|uniref:amphoterin-induced protein 3-like isoform X2 n=1 Tax=Sycon ciliatum TaxID=27933 RepID=UPI0020AD6ED5|eukprot:scpid57880/ scgid2126/ Leucine-rich repeats and immunoglobulin-like domains protein 2